MCPIFPPDEDRPARPDGTIIPTFRDAIGALKDAHIAAREDGTNEQWKEDMIFGMWCLADALDQRLATIEQKLGITPPP
jgi:hypothetical protein